MKNLKYVKTFESFKVNEEVPFNQDEADIMNLDRTKELKVGRRDWSEKERLDLQRLGADTIDRGYATFVESEFTVSVTKEIERSSNISEPTRTIYRCVSDVIDESPKIKTEMTHSSKEPYQSENDTWMAFLKKLNNFIKNGGKIELSYDPDSDWHKKQGWRQNIFTGKMPNL